jgi:chemotaxis response regulator CheB
VATGSGSRERLVAIGSSAGGPAALASLLAGLPKDFLAAIVVVQHIDAHLAAGMADWLDAQCALTVRVAAEGDRPTAGSVLIAGTSDHLVLRSAYRLGYVAEPREMVYRPSVDAFFHSVVRQWHDEAVGVLLTGMGRDGALGLKALREHGFHTIAQDEATSAVYGMPKAAATLGAAVDILPIDRIASRLMMLFGGERELAR